MQAEASAHPYCIRFRAVLAAGGILAGMEVEIRRVDPASTRPLRRRVLRPHQHLDELAADEGREGSAWFAALAGDEIVATAGVMPEPAPDHPDDPGGWRLRGMATDPDWRGRGLGARLVEAAVTHVIERGGSYVWCSARTPARAFYERHGFVATSEVYEKSPLGPHLRMERRL